MVLPRIGKNRLNLGKKETGLEVEQYGQRESQTMM